MNPTDTIANPSDTSSITAVIRGMGTSVPKYRADHLASASFADKMSCNNSSQSRKVAALYRRTGIEHRGSVLLDQNAHSEIVNDFYPPLSSPEDRGPTTQLRSDRYALEAPALALGASRAAIRNSGITVDSITHLVTVSCTGFSAPGIDIELIDQLGLPATTQRVQVGFMGCHGAINGLRAASGLVAASPGANVLMCSVELCSLHYQYGYDPDRIVSGALFADGSAAMVLNSLNIDEIESPEMDTTAFGNTAHRVAATGSCLVPASRDAMTWRIGDFGYEMTLSAKVPGLIEKHLKSFLEPWLAEQGETIDSIQGWAVHPGGSRILTAAESTLGLPGDAVDTSRGVLSDHGNMSSATMLFILERFTKADKPKPWLMLGFGPGLEIEVALIR
ncbi:Alpha-pyrone synthesis polyketide synthase-like Pks18 [Rubripirellula lacrimiformis]|uniref:Alpha-pyrone synthesis polyketide synthase-like Pks18 n=1 Tax=Rubripirellula lacrimiformis TaxID=1930273 RepID=A0A517N7X8_9BACT|nr:type III polyketide synthase [Rubripirellula lacrimiformis]QDT03231.1 Alpha-pyrone synthesis polyketide synthase-like Pks18 [Rubripirellula lacrimiformis]